MESKEHETGHAYWNRTLHNAEAFAADFPYDRPAQSQIDTHNGSGAVAVTVSTALQRAIGHWQTETASTLFTTALSAFQLLVHKVTQQADVCVASLGPSSATEKDGVRPYVATVDAKSTFADFNAAVRATVQEVERYAADFSITRQQIPVRLRALCECVFNSVVFQALTACLLQIGLRLCQAEEPVQSKPAVSNFDLELCVESSHTNGIRFSFYHSGRFDLITVETIAARFVSLLEALFLNKQTSVPISQLSVLLPSDRAALASLNGTSIDLGTILCTHDAILEQANKQPDKTAVTLDGESLTYSALVRRAELVAAFLQRECKVGSNVVVIQCVERSLEMAVGMLGIMMAGGVYCPLDPSMPLDRVQTVATQTKAQVLLVTATQRSRFAGNVGAVQLMCIQDILSTPSIDADVKTRKAGTQLSDLAYIITTSGSTGAPKSAMLTHKAFMSSVNAVARRLQIVVPSDVTLQLASCTFDVHVFEIVGILALGATVLMLRDKGNLDMEYLLSTIERGKARFVWFVPSAARVLLEYVRSSKRRDALKGVRVFGLAGEALPPSLVADLRLLLAPEAAIVNLYGPAEASLSVSWHTCTKADETALTVPIGRAIPNYELLPLDSFGNLVPVGVLGELYFKGLGVFEGYINQPAQTEKALITHAVHGRLYKTGDLVRLRQDGNLVFVGRADFQVKINGQRLELGEIEATIMKHPRAVAVVAAKHEKKGRAFLAAFVAVREFNESKDEQKQLKAELVALCMKSLPSFMVPSAWVLLSKMPLNNNGKADRKQLPAPKLENGNHCIVLPRNVLEKAIHAAFTTALQRPELSVEDDFFAVGGTSLLAMTLLSKLRTSSAALSQLTVAEFFSHSSVAALAQFSSTSTRIKSPAVAWPRLGLTRGRASTAQQRVFLDTQVRLEKRLGEGARALYNVPMCYRIAGEVDAARLAKSLLTLVSRHEALRTAMEMDTSQGVLLQIVKAVPAEFKVVCRSAKSDTDLQNIVSSFSLEPFEVIGLNLRCCLVALQWPKQPECALLLCADHAFFDGWSVDVLVHELSALYAGQLLPALPLQYLDYAEFEHKWLQTPEFNSSLQYWKNTLAGAESLLTELPLDRPRTSASASLAERQSKPVSVTLGSSLSEAIAKWQAESKTTLFMTMMASLQLLLHKVSQQTDICVGAVSANRYRSELEPLIGMFVNTLPYRATVQPESSFAAFQASVRALCLDVMHNSAVPFDKLVQELIPSRQSQALPFFQVVLLVLDAADSEMHASDLKLTSAPTTLLTLDMPFMFDLVVIVRQLRNGLECSFMYSPALFNHATIDTLADRWLSLLQCLFEKQQTSAPISQLSVMLDSDRFAMHTLNNTDCDFGPPRCVHDVILEQASKHADKTAVVLDDAELSYTVLVQRAKRVSAFLQRECKVGPNVVVMQCVERSFDMTIGMLGIILAGGVYCPVDPAMPHERMQFIATQCGVVAFLTTPAFLARSPSLAMPSAVRMCSLADAINFSSDTPSLLAKPDDACCIICTSGSTGVPKPIVLLHRCYVNLLLGQVELRAMHTFDIWGSMMLGATVVMLRRGGMLDLEYFTHTIASKGVTYVPLVPSFANNMINYLAGIGQTSRLARLRNITIGGEIVAPALITRLRTAAHKAEVWHVYGECVLSACLTLSPSGPTECTIFTLYHKLSRADEQLEVLPLGRPWPNLKSFVLDPQLHPVPAEAIGELYVGGAGLMRGYQNQSALTAQVLIKHPTYGMLYKSGDLCRLRQDGILVFVGRADFQVKINGQRLELGEIEATIMKHPRAVAVVAAKHEEKGRQFLVAYVSIRELKDGKEQEQLKCELVGLCKKSLPGFMVPKAWVLVDRFPLTSSGKVDRKQLPPPKLDAVDRVVVVPRNQLEKQIHAVFSAVLQKADLSVDDDFFAAGGTSLSAMTLLARLRPTTPALARLTVAELFSSSTVVALAKLAGSKDITAEAAEAPWARLGLTRGRASAVQRGIFLDAHVRLEKQMGERALSMYNVPACFRVRGGVDAVCLARCLLALVDRHESLRTALQMDVSPEQGQLAQIVKAAPTEFPLALKAAQTETDLRDITNAFLREPFDSASGLNIRCCLVSIRSGSALLLCADHAFFDGWSLKILVSELSALYAGQSLSALPLQYLDYAEHEARWMQSSLFRASLQYWKTTLSGAETLLTELPLDRPRTDASAKSLTPEPKPVRVTLPPSLCEAIAKWQVESKTTLFMTMMASLQLLLHKISQQTDICVGSVSAGRYRAELEPLIGMFVNTLPYRSTVKPEFTFAELQVSVRALCSDVMRNSAVPFDVLVDELVQSKQSLARPFFQVLLLVPDAGDSEQHASDLRLGSATSTAIETPQPVMFDLVVTVRQLRSGLECSFEYSPALFDHETIDSLAARWLFLLQSLFEKQLTSAPISQLSVLLDTDRAIMRKLNDSAVDFGPPRCIHDVILQQAIAHADKPAVVLDEAQLSFKTLVQQAKRVAAFLQRECKVGPNVVVVQCVERSLEMVVGMLGILLAGGVYCPVDPSMPTDRLSAIAARTDAVTVLVSSTQQSRLASIASQLPRLVAFQQIADSKLTATPARNQPSDLVFIVTTSGSTGEPKAAAISHAAFWNFTTSMVHRRIGPTSYRDVCLQYSHCTFDAHTWEIFGVLSIGATVVMLRPDGLLDMEYLTSVIQRQQVTYVMFVPSVAVAMMEHLRPTERASRLASVEMVNLVGESFKIEVAEAMRKSLHPDARIWNGYGPAECTLGCAFHQYKSGEQPPVPIGTAFCNCKLHVLDAAKQDVPVGSVGELYVGGVGVFSGYMKQPEQTSQALLNHAEYGRLYKTGDLVRLRRDGNLVYLGRADFQVKINGQRLELGEIEATIMQHKQAAAAVVTKRSDDGREYLVGYVAIRDLKDNKEQEQHLKGELTSLCKKTLPPFMVPSAWVLLDRMPLTSNGKVDRKQLPAPKFQSSDRVIVAPRNDLEKTIHAQFSAVLHRPDLSVDDDFFACGGTSLLAMTLLSRLRSASVIVTVTELLANGSVADLAALVSKSTRGKRQTLSWTPLGLTSGRAAPAQQRVYLDAHIRLQRQMGKKALCMYNVPVCFRLNGTVDAARMAQCLLAIVARHEALRTALETDGKANGTLRQVVKPPPAEFLISHCSAHTESDLQPIVDEFANEPFDLSAGLNLRCCLVSLEWAQTPSTALLLCSHHAFFDGWSAKVLIDELSALYACRSLVSLPLQYVDYAEHEHKRMQSAADFQGSLQYWKTTLAGAESLLTDLPLDRPRSTAHVAQVESQKPTLDKHKSIVVVQEKPVKGHSRHKSSALNLLGDGRPVLNRPRSSALSFQMDSRPVRFVLPSSFCEAILRWQAESKTTLFMVMMASLQLLLHKVSQQTDICVGSVSANRYRAELEPLIGMFVNTLPYRSTIKPESTFAAFQACVRALCLDVMSHSAVPFDTLVRELMPNRQSQALPFCQVLLEVQEQNAEQHASALKLGSALVKPLSVELPSKFDLTVSVRCMQTSELECSFSYSPLLFERQTVSTLAERWLLLLQCLFEKQQTSVPIFQLSILLESDRASIRKLNDTVCDFGPPRCIHDMILEQATRNADKTAVVLDDARLSYRELVERAKRVAAFLQRECKVGPNVVVVQCVERSLDMVVGILGILLAGGVYCPVDTSMPVDRLLAIIANTDASAVLVSSKQLARLENFKSQLPRMVSIHGMLDAQTTLREGPVAQPADLAFIVTTSGSTGEPKSAALSHHAFWNFTSAMFHSRMGAVFSSDVCLQTSTCTFDIHVFEAVGVLAMGASVVMLRPNGLLDIDYLSSTIQRHNVTFMPLVPSVALAVIDHARSSGIRLSSVRSFHLVGEPLTSFVVEGLRVIAPNAEFWNGYGPAECTIYSTYYKCTGSETGGIPIGVCMPNYTLHLLDQQLQDVPVEAVGELYIGGAGVFNGYLKRPDLTNKSLIIHKAYGRLYKTGDLVRLRRDGNLVFVGRADFQVKINGQRLELGEIEATIMKHPRAVAVVAAKHEEKNRAFLVGYVAIREFKDRKEENQLKGELTALCKKSLPPFMVPQAWALLERMPLNLNGKVDRKQLPAPELSTSTAVVSPRSALETKIAAIWAEVLAIDVAAISIDRPFADLGGTSLNLVRLMTRMRAQLGVVQVSIGALLDHPTIEQQALYLESLLEPSPQADVSTSTSSDLHAASPVRSCIRNCVIATGQLFGLLLLLANMIGTILLSSMVIEAIPSFTNNYFVSNFTLLPARLIFIFAFQLTSLATLKWLIVGKYHAGVYQRWSWYHYRCWLVGVMWRLNDPFIRKLYGTSLYAAYLRLMGARIGSSCHIYTSECVYTDLITIGDGCFLDYDARLKADTYERGHKFVLRPVIVGSQCIIEHSAVLAPGATLASNVRVKPFSCVQACVSANVIVEGSGVVPYDAQSRVAFARRSCFAPMAEVVVIALLSFLAAQPLSISIFVYSLYSSDWLSFFIYFPFWILAWQLCQVLLLVLFVRVVVGHTQPGRYVVGSFTFLRGYWLSRAAINSLGGGLELLTGTPLINMVLRAMGANIGKRVEIVSAGGLRCPPNLLTVEESATFASNVRVGSCRIEGGCWSPLPITVGSWTYMGNDSAIEMGAKLPPKCTVAALSNIAAGSAFSESSVLIGSPARNLTVQSTAASTIDRPLGFVRWLLVWLSHIWSAAVLCGTLVSSFAISAAIFKRNSIQLLTDFITFSTLPDSATDVWMFLAFLMTAMCFLPVVLGTAVCLTKWLFVGRQHEGAWHFGGWFWVKSWFFGNVLSMWMELFGQSLADTVWLPIFWRSLGAHIGKNVIMRGVCLTDVDLVSIGDDVIVGSGAIIQPHTLENRVFKANKIKIGSGVKVGSDSLVLRGAVVSEAVVLHPCTLILSHDFLPPNTSWSGCPAQFCGQQTRVSLEKSPLPTPLPVEIVVESMTSKPERHEEKWADRVRQPLEISVTHTSETQSPSPA